MSEAEGKVTTSSRVRKLPPHSAVGRGLTAASLAVIFDRPVAGITLFSQKSFGLVRDLNPGPLAPKARIIPLDQRAAMHMAVSCAKIDHTTVIKKSIAIRAQRALADKSIQDEVFQGLLND